MTERFALRRVLAMTERFALRRVPAMTFVRWSMPQ